jgi:hypothetical protein
MSLHYKEHLTSFIKAGDKKGFQPTGAVTQEYPQNRNRIHRFCVITDGGLQNCKFGPGLELMCANSYLGILHGSTREVNRTGRLTAQV